MKISISMASDRGKARGKNEDNLYVNGLILEQQNNGLAPGALKLSTEFPQMFGVFDGMGGYAAGERASYLAAGTAKELVSKYGQNMPGEALMLRICELANQRVCDEMLHGENSCIGTTASMLHLNRDEYTVCNVGDSPIFLYRSGTLSMIAKEHTERENYERITGKKAPPNKKFRLTQNIGIFVDEMMIEPYCAAGKIQPGDCFLLCSDGLTDMVSNEVIAQVLSRNASPREKVQQLLQMALNNGGKDNITIVLICAEQDTKKGAANVPAMIATIIAEALVIIVLAVLLCFSFRQKPTLSPEQPPCVTEQNRDATPDTSGKPTEATSDTPDRPVEATPDELRQSGSDEAANQ